MARNIFGNCWKGAATLFISDHKPRARLDAIRRALIEKRRSNARSDRGDPRAQQRAVSQPPIRGEHVEWKQRANENDVGDWTKKKDRDREIESNMIRYSSLRVGPR